MLRPRNFKQLASEFYITKLGPEQNKILKCARQYMHHSFKNFRMIYHAARKNKFRIKTLIEDLNGYR